MRRFKSWLSMKLSAEEEDNTSDVAAASADSALVGLWLLPVFVVFATSTTAKLIAAMSSSLKKNTQLY
jgi:hypothetical protein